MSLAPYFGYITVNYFDCPPFLMFNNDDCTTCQNILVHQFEPASMRLWCTLARNATGFLDIGANVGVYALAAAAVRPDIQIHAFEPNPHAFARLRVNKHRNGFSNIVEHQEALGHDDGVPIRLSWRAKPGNPISTGACVGDHADTGPMEIAIALLRRLDAMALPGIGERGAIKIDVEGAEGLVFRGMGPLLGQRPDIILESFDPESCAEITAATRRLGYRYFAIDETAGTLTEQDRLVARERSAKNYNQFLSVRDPPI